MTLRLSLVVSIALFLPVGAQAQASADVTQCLREVCESPDSQVSQCAVILNQCFAAKDNCDDLLLTCEGLDDDCRTSCLNDPFGTMAGN